MSNFNNNDKEIIYRCAVPDPQYLPNDYSVNRELVYSEINDNFHTLEGMTISGMTYVGDTLTIQRADGRTVSAVISASGSSSGSTEGVFEPIHVGNIGSSETGDTEAQFLASNGSPRPLNILGSGGTKVSTSANSSVIISSTKNNERRLVLDDGERTFDFAQWLTSGESGTTRLVLEGRNGIDVDLIDSPERDTLIVRVSGTEFESTTVTPLLVNNVPIGDIVVPATTYQNTRNITIEGINGIDVTTNEDGVTIIDGNLPSGTHEEMGVYGQGLTADTEMLFGLLSTDGEKSLVFASSRDIDSTGNQVSVSTEIVEDETTRKIVNHALISSLQVKHKNYEGISVNEPKEGDDENVGNVDNRVVLSGDTYMDVTYSHDDNTNIDYFTFSPQLSAVPLTINNIPFSNIGNTFLIPTTIPTTRNVSIEGRDGIEFFKDTDTDTWVIKGNTPGGDTYYETTIGYQTIAQSTGTESTTVMDTVTTDEDAAPLVFSPSNSVVFSSSGETVTKLSPHALISTLGVIDKFDGAISGITANNGLAEDVDNTVVFRGIDGITISYEHMNEGNLDLFTFASNGGGSGITPSSASLTVNNLLNVGNFLTNNGDTTARNLAIIGSGSVDVITEQNRIVISGGQGSSSDFSAITVNGMSLGNFATDGNAVKNLVFRPGENVQISTGQNQTDCFVTISANGGGGGSDMMTLISRNDLLELRNTSGLTKGMQYRIFDYECSVNPYDNGSAMTESDLSAASHNFDIIVTSNGVDSLDENARAVSDIGYFSGNDLSAWEIKYDIDPSVAKYPWGPINPFIVITVNDDNYSPEHPHGEVVQRKLYRYSEADTETYYCWRLPESYSTTAMVFTLSDTPTTGDNLYNVSGQILVYYDGETMYNSEVLHYEESSNKGLVYYMKDEFGNEAPYDFKNVLIKSGDSERVRYNYTFTKNDSDMSIDGNSCNSNKIGAMINENGSFLFPKNTFEANTPSDKFIGNVLYDNANGNSFIGECRGNILQNGCNNNIFDSASRNVLAEDCSACHFSASADNNIVGKASHDVTFQSNSSEHTLGQFCSNITLGEDQKANVFGSHCENIDVSVSGSSYNKFGINCHNITSSSSTMTNCEFENGVKFLNISAKNRSLNNLLFCEGYGGADSENIITLSLDGPSQGERITIGFKNGVNEPTTKIWNEANDGLPTGGTVGQVLKKMSNMDYDASWQNESTGGTEIYSSVTYTQLKTASRQGELTPGMLYRITDYNFTTSESALSGAGHGFDIIVKAITDSQLSEDAYATQRSGISDIYFNGHNLAAWQIRYAIENNKQRFNWADSVNGKGVIYYMKDEFGNSASYDFKNCLFIDKTILYYTFSYDNNGTIEDCSMLPNCVNNVIEGNVFTQGITTSEINHTNILDIGKNIFTCTHTSGAPQDNIIKEGSVGNRLYGDNIRENIIGRFSQNNSLNSGCTNNVIGDYTISNYLSERCSKNIFGNGCSGNVLGQNSVSNVFGINVNGIRILLPNNIVYATLEDCVFENNVSVVVDKINAIGVVKNYLFYNGLSISENITLDDTSTGSICFRTSVGMTSRGRIKMWNEADNGVTNTTQTAITNGNISLDLSSNEITTLKIDSPSTVNSDTSGKLYSGITITVPNDSEKYKVLISIDSGVQSGTNIYDLITINGNCSNANILRNYTLDDSTIRTLVLVFENGICSVSQYQTNDTSSILDNNQGGGEEETNPNTTPNGESEGEGEGTESRV